MSPWYPGDRSLSLTEADLSTSRTEDDFMVSHIFEDSLGSLLGHDENDKNFLGNDSGLTNEEDFTEDNTDREAELSTLVEQFDEDVGNAVFL